MWCLSVSIRPSVGLCFGCLCGFVSVSLCVFCVVGGMGGVGGCVVCVEKVTSMRLWRTYWRWKNEIGRVAHFEGLCAKENY